MLIAFDYDENNVVHKEKGRIVLKVKSYPKYSTCIHLWATKGMTYKEFEKNDALGGRTVRVGERGGIILY